MGYNAMDSRWLHSPGWRLRWTWAEKEVIWSIIGARSTEQGDCSRFEGNIPHSCMKDPKVVDLPLGTPYNMQIANCCRGGLISSYVQDPATASSSFHSSVGASGNNNKTVRLPKNFTIRDPGLGYTCGPAKIVKSTRFRSASGRRTTQVLMTWNVTCTYSSFLARKTSACCVSLSSFYNKTIVNCPNCACGCQNSSCLKKDEPSSASIGSPSKSSFLQAIQCSSHMCPIRVHWHVERNLKKYWLVNVTITNFNYGMNYSDWNLVIQHPQFDNLALTFGSNYRSLTSPSGINDTAMLWGIKHYNDLLREAGPFGQVQSKLQFRKNSSTFTRQEGWTFPRRVYFNGDNCVMPTPDSWREGSSD
ncbi:COBRA-like protein 1 isoform X2 [Iris pallida]|uniref:COBRA-like protein 1 isoform X2 n=1 Tax=Iris pallida TaxID=29817 RepID=A0AAX6FSW8_IRIPA|nr:COBRA-like protein 1 isoform X2 [Iris pallida]